MGIKDYFPSPEEAVKFEPEELALHLIKCLVYLQDGRDDQHLNLHNFLIALESEGYVQERKGGILEAITEAWMWLEREGMLAPRPGKDRNWIYVTKRGRILAEQSDISKYLLSNIIPEQSLDPILANKVLPLFIRGDYDTAVFQAFKEVEIRVRKAADLKQEMIGVDLVRKAFDVENGKLTNLGRPKAEREAMAHLFAGAIGLYKNPSSHRDIDWEDPQECAELIYFANHLLRIIDNQTIFKELKG